MDDLDPAARSILAEGRQLHVGGALVAAGDGWPGSVGAVGDAPPLPGRRDAVVGWEAPWGTLLLPARVETATTATVPADAIGQFELDADRRTTWDGVETQTSVVS